MKKYCITSCVYMGLGLVLGVVYREVTKGYSFTGSTALGKMHLHALILGMFFFLIVSLIEKNFSIKESKLERWFYISYNVGLGILLLMLFLRGIFQVTLTDVSKGMNGVISGIAGLGHMLLAIGLILFFVILLKKCSNADLNNNQKKKEKDKPTI